MPWSTRARWWPRSRSSRSPIRAATARSLCRASLADGPARCASAPFRPWRARLIQTELPSVAAKVLDKTVRITRDRIAAIGGELRRRDAAARMSRRRWPPRSSAAIAAGSDMLLIAGASAITDRSDVLPAGDRGGRRADPAFRHAGRSRQPPAAGPSRRSAGAGPARLLPLAQAQRLRLGAAAAGCRPGGHWRATSCAWASAAC